MLNSLTQEFVVELAHDLRNPLTIIRSCADLLQRDPDIHKVSRTEALIARIIFSVDRIEGMLCNILDESVVHDREPELRIGPCHLNHLVREIIEDYLSIFNSGLVLEADSEIHGMWDRQAIRRAITNLIDNAIKFAEPSSAVILRLRQSNSWVQIHVHNRGEKIHPEICDKIFERFERGETPTHSGILGWGLGLTIVKKIAESHGGRVRIDQTESDGPTFLLEIPLSPSA